MITLGSGALAALMLIAAPTILVGDGLVDERYPASGEPGRSVQISAARGESESIQIWIANDGDHKVLTRFALEWRGEFAPEEAIYRRPDGAERGLLPFSETALAPEATLRLLARITVPTDAASGPQSGSAVATFSDGRELRVDILLDVYDFSIPEQPVMPVLIGMDREAFQRACGVDESLERWAPAYAALADARVGFQVWPAPEAPADEFYDYTNIDAVKAHLQHVAGLNGVPAMEVGGQAGDLLRGWPPPVLDSPQDPLQLLLFSLMGALDQASWAGETLLLPAALPPRDAWQDVRNANARVRRADERYTRLLAAPPHPFFERYTDIWALPPGIAPAAISLLREGWSILRYRQPEIETISGSDGGPDATGLYETRPADAFDQCELSPWSSGGAAEDSPWIEVRFRNPIHLERLAIIWGGDMPGPAPRVETAYHPDAFTEATVRWESRLTLSEAGQPIRRGEFRFPRDCIALRFLFDGAQQAVSIAEVLINQDGRETEKNPAPPVAPWVDLRFSGDPWRGEGELAPRVLPWYCWARGFTGILGPVAEPGDGPAFIACAPDGLAPGEALFELADGLEDMAYLRAYWIGAHAGDFTPPEHVNPGALPPAEVGAGSGHQQAVVREQRRQMGLLLSGHAVVTRNFGPRR